jgi:hypothetical protein
MIRCAVMRMGRRRAAWHRALPARCRAFACGAAPSARTSSSRAPWAGRAAAAPPAASAGESAWACGCGRVGAMGCTRRAGWRRARRGAAEDAPSESPVAPAGCAPAASLAGTAGCGCVCGCARPRGRPSRRQCLLVGGEELQQLELLARREPRGILHRPLAARRRRGRAEEGRHCRYSKLGDSLYHYL